MRIYLRKIYWFVFLLLPGMLSAETENIVTISANGMRTTYLLETLQHITTDKSSKTEALVVTFNNNYKQMGNLKSILFNVEAEEEPSVEEVKIETTETTAAFTWPALEGVASYQLVIFKDVASTERICTLTFNSNGQLINIDFSVAGLKSTKKVSIASVSFTVTGLSEGSEYQYELKALDETETALKSYGGSFVTKGESTAAGEVVVEQPQIYSVGKKIIVDCPTVEDITFYNLKGESLGKCIVAKHCECKVTLSGVYIVTAGDFTQKILVK